MPNSYLNNNVYIVGAGFTSDAGLPTVPTFLSRMRSASHWLAEHDRDREANAIARVMDFRQDAAAAAYRAVVDPENIEELFSLASASGGRPFTRDIRLAISATLDYSSIVHGNPTPSTVYYENDNKPYPRHLETYENGRTDRGFRLDVPYYFEVIGKLIGYFPSSHNDHSSNNTFITFNYDTIIEQALDDLEVPFSYGLRQTGVSVDSSAPAGYEPDNSSAIEVLKLHGSLNWARQRDSRASTTIFGSYSGLAGEELVPTIVPPTWRKQFTIQLSSVWDKAVQAIQKATRLTIIGFSIPPTDIHFRYLIAAGLSQNISLDRIYFINPDRSQALKDRLFETIRPNLVEQSVAQIFPDDLRGFVRNDNHLQAINRVVSAPWRQ